MGSWGTEDSPQGGSWRTPERWWIVEQMGQAVRQLADPRPHICAQINLEEQWGGEQTEQPRAPARENKASNL